MKIIPVQDAVGPVKELSLDYDALGAVRGDLLIVGPAGVNRNLLCPAQGQTRIQ